MHCSATIHKGLSENVDWSIGMTLISIMLTTLLSLLSTLNYSYAYAYTVSLKHRTRSLSSGCLALCAGHCRKEYGRYGVAKQYVDWVLI